MDAMEPSQGQLFDAPLIVVLRLALSLVQQTQVLV